MKRFPECAKVGVILGSCQPAKLDDHPAFVLDDLVAVGILPEPDVVQASLHVVRCRVFCGLAVHPFTEGERLSCAVSKKNELSQTLSKDDSGFCECHLL